MGPCKSTLTSAIDQIVANEPEEIAKEFINAREHLTFMDRHIDRFNLVQKGVVEKTTNSESAWPMGPSWYHHHLQLLREYTDEVAISAHSTIGSFLPLLGHDAELSFGE